jgi:hypothetical protein
MPGPLKKPKSSQQSSILSFIKKDKPPLATKPASPKFISKPGKKPVAAITPMQVNREPTIDQVDLTSSPDLLNDQDDEIFNEVSTPVVQNNTKKIEATEASWLTQIFGKTPQFDSSISSADDSPDTRPLVGTRFNFKPKRQPNLTSDSPIGRQSSHRTTISGLKNLEVPEDVGESLVVSKALTKNLKFEETKSPWDDDDDDFQDDTKVKGRRVSETRGKPSTLSSSDLHTDTDDELVPDFGLGNSPQFDPENEEYDDHDHDEPAFLEENILEDSVPETGATYSPPNTPPPCQLLETCPPPNFGFLKKDPPTPTLPVPESQVIFDPSPEKPPTFRRFSSTGRSRLSTNRKISPGATRSKPILLASLPTRKGEHSEKQTSILPQGKALLL